MSIIPLPDQGGAFTEGNLDAINSNFSFISGVIGTNSHSGLQSVTQSYNNATNSLSNGTDTQVTYRNSYYFPNYAYGVQLHYTNAYYASPTLVQTGPGNAVTLTAGLEYNGKTIPVTWGGQPSILVADAGFVVSDPVSYDIPAGSTVYVRHCLTVTDGQHWVYGYGGGSSSSYTNNGSDATTGTGALTNAGGGINTSLMSAVLGTTSPPAKAVYIAGDSIAYGVNNNYTRPPFANNAVGYVIQGLGCLLASPPYNWVNTPVIGTTIAERLTGIDPSHVSLMANCQAAICELGINDLGEGVAAMQANYRAYWAMLAARGMSVWQTTITPQTDSTDFWTSASNQSVRSMENTRVTINDWIRTNPAPLAGHIEVADIVEANAMNVLTRNGGVWHIPAPAAVTRIVTSAAAGTLVDSTQTWTTDQWIGYCAVITSGTGAYEGRQIYANTATSLTIFPNWPVTPDSTSHYVIQDTPTLDGNHPNPSTYARLAVPITSWAAQNLT